MTLQWLLTTFALIFPFCARGELHLELLKAPPGFKIEVLAEGMKASRQLALDPKSGTIFVGSTSGEVYALPQGESVGTKRKVVRIAEGLTNPNGVAVRDGALFVGENPRILKFDGIMKSLDRPPKPKVIRDDLPREKWHGSRYLAFGPDGLLYFGIGSPCNICRRAAPFGTIQRMKPDGTGLETFASGIRNTVGFDWDPQDGSLWFTDNGRDHLGDDSPPDELNRATRKDMFFGFPYCHGKGIPDPEYGKERACSTATTVAQELGPHVASLGMKFYQGKMFPPEYRGRIFIAEHGSWNRSVPLGYRLSTVRIEAGKALSYEVFAEGWLQKNGPWGRPVDVLALPDGSLAVSDDFAGAVYRISWNGSAGASPVSDRH